MADTINGVSRYEGVSVDTSFDSMDNMMDRVQAIPLSFGNASTSAVVYVSAPADGKLVSMQLVDAIGAATTDVTVVNNSNSDASMLAATDITTVADIVYDLTGSLSATAANLYADKGDLITVTVAQAGGICAGTLYFAVQG